MSGFVNLEATKYRHGGTYDKVIADIQEDAVCPFCPEHLSRYHKNPILFETKHWLATKNMYPYKGAKHHLLLIHKTHIQAFEEVAPDAWAELQTIVSATLKNKHITGGTLLMRFGDTTFTGASVSHLHAHVVSGTGDPEAEPVLGRLG